MEGRRSIQALFVVVIALTLLGLNGCGGGYGNIPSEKISAGDKAVSDAKGSNASVNAPVELKAAEDKLAAAKAALNKKEYDEASRLAEQASVDADYARAKGSSEKARKKADEIRQNINALKQEIDQLSQKITLEGGK